MRVDGEEITAAQIERALGEISGSGDPFTFRDLIGALCRVGVSRGASDRAADRILQRERKAGRIDWVQIGRDKFWTFLHPEEERDNG